MLSDYAKSAERHKQRQKKNAGRNSPVSKTLILVTLVLTAALGMLLFKLAQIPASEDYPSAITEAAKNANKSSPQQTTSAESTPSESEAREQYDFYTLLPESEVIAAKVDEYAFQEKQLEGNVEALYMLQAGSFRSRYDADRLRAKLILEGLKTQISTVTGKNGSTWHRVLVGPLASRSEINRAQDKLAAANTESMLLKIKP